MNEMWKNNNLLLRENNKYEDPRMNHKYEDYKIDGEQFSKDLATLSKEHDYDKRAPLAFIKAFGYWDLHDFIISYHDVYDSMEDFVYHEVLDPDGDFNFRHWDMDVEEMWKEGLINKEVEKEIPERVEEYKKGGWLPDKGFEEVDEENLICDILFELMDMKGRKFYDVKGLVNWFLNNDIYRFEEYEGKVYLFDVYF